MGLERFHEYYPRLRSRHRYRMQEDHVIQSRSAYLAVAHAQRVAIPAGRDGNPAAQALRTTVALGPGPAPTPAPTNRQTHLRSAGQPPFVHRGCCLDLADRSRKMTIMVQQLGDTAR